MTALARLNRGLHGLLNWLVIGTVVALMVPLLLQILSRYGDFLPRYIWTEEASRFLLIWMVMLGAMLGVRELTHFDVDVWPTLSARANTRLRLGRDVEVLGYCRELETLRPDDPRPYRIRARVYRNRARWELFIDAAREALKRSDPPDDELRVEVADALLHQGRTAEARREFDAIKTRRPDLTARAPTVEAQLLIQEGQLARADEVIYLVEGKVAATGTHESLLEYEPGYRALVARDSQDEEEVVR